MSRQYDTVIYHAGCADGWTAAWVAVRAGNEGAELVPANYGEGPPDVRGKRVLVVDFCYPRGEMLLLAAAAKALTVLDHHKTAAEALDGFADECDRGHGLPRPEVVFDMTKSGARLAWEHFHAGAFTPPLVRYVEDRDLWAWKLPKSREVNAALRSYPMAVQTWDDLHGYLTTNFDDLAREGAAILRWQDKVVEDHVRFAVEERIGGHLVPCVNATVLTSEIAGALARGRPFGACWFQNAGGGRVYSLRSDENGIDVSAVAKALGGGGHPRAAGFEAR